MSLRTIIWQIRSVMTEVKKSIAIISSRMNPSILMISGFLTNPAISVIHRYQLPPPFKIEKKMV